MDCPVFKSAFCFIIGGPGLLDPCEKAKVDALQNMAPQEREDITAAAQVGFLF